MTNDIFAENAWYFRNSLVRANYNDLRNGIHETTEYLEIFLRNFLLNENHPLHNRTLHISGTFKEIEKPDIETVKPDIEKIFRPKTTGHILKLIDAFPGQTIFGRSDAMKVLDIKPSRASELLKEMAEHGIIEPVSEHGKGKYRFRIDLCTGTADPMDLVFYLKDAESEKAQNKAAFDLKENLSMNYLNNRER